MLKRRTSTTGSGLWGLNFVAADSSFGQSVHGCIIRGGEGGAGAILQPPRRRSLEQRKHRVVRLSCCFEQRKQTPTGRHGRIA